MVLYKVDVERHVSIVKVITVVGVISAHRSPLAVKVRQCYALVQQVNAVLVMDVNYVLVKVIVALWELHAQYGVVARGLYALLVAIAGSQRKQCAAKYCG